MVGRGMVVLARKNYAEYTKVIQINSELKAISKEYKERERIFQQAIAHNEARRKCACVMMCVCVCLLVLVTSGVIFAMHRPTTLTWQASMDGIPFKMYNASTDWVAYTQTLRPTWQVDWSQQYSWFSMQTKSFVDVCNKFLEVAMPVVLLVLALWFMGWYRESVLFIGTQFSNLYTAVDMGGLGIRLGMS
jgi:hypothetical protein